MKFSSLPIGSLALLGHVFAAPPIYKEASINADLPFTLTGFACPKISSSTRAADNSFMFSADDFSTFSANNFRAMQIEISELDESMLRKWLDIFTLSGVYTGTTPHFLYPIKQNQRYTMSLVLSSNMVPVGAISRLADGELNFCFFSYRLSALEYAQRSSQQGFIGSIE